MNRKIALYFIYVYTIRSGIAAGMIFISNQLHFR